MISLSVMLDVLDLCLLHFSLCTGDWFLKLLSKNSNQSLNEDIVSNHDNNLHYVCA